MDFERFQEFMLESAARHDAEIATIRESLKTINGTLKSVSDSLKSAANTVGHVVDNQVFLQERLDLLAQDLSQHAKENRAEAAQIHASLRDLERIVFRHVTDPSAHSVG